MTSEKSTPVPHMPKPSGQAESRNRWSGFSPSQKRMPSVPSSAGSVCQSQPSGRVSFREMYPFSYSTRVPFSCQSSPKGDAASKSAAFRMSSEVPQGSGPSAPGLPCPQPASRAKLKKAAKIAIFLIGIPSFPFLSR